MARNSAVKLHVVSIQIIRLSAKKVDNYRPIGLAVNCNSKICGLITSPVQNVHFFGFFFSFVQNSHTYTC